MLVVLLFDLAFAYGCAAARAAEAALILPELAGPVFDGMRYKIRAIMLQGECRRVRSAELVRIVQKRPCSRRLWQSREREVDIRVFYVALIDKRINSASGSSLVLPCLWRLTAVRRAMNSLREDALVQDTG
ncbi:hypothetical protein FRC20_002719 [Serendipita sp. 405]|nr:hypothetical protein FRC16_002530 [Serendipita sp. 398]KAG8847615.1 hypothetical protein FRC20_002719 [Serendipita sp. 405]